MQLPIYIEPTCLCLVTLHACVYYQQTVLRLHRMPVVMLICLKLFMSVKSKLLRACVVLFHVHRL